MCRLVGIVASETTEFGLCLKEAPRSLATLSREHPDGWGIAIYEHDRSTWRVHKGIERAYEDRRFLEIAARSAGHVLVAHVRQKTVGSTRIENTHPFERDGWIFAHNGTITDVGTLRADTSRARLAEVTGDTDSELLFAHLLTRLDEAGLTRLEDEDAREEATTLLDDVTRRLREAQIGAFNFLLSDGRTCFAHRLGRSLYLLERTPSDPVRETRDVTSSATLVTKWTHHRHAVLVASERLTDEPWQELPEGTFLRMDRDPVPAVFSAEPGRAA
jgi:predicted glutamine amidotransferase